MFLLNIELDSHRRKKIDSRGLLTGAVYTRCVTDLSVTVHLCSLFRKTQNESEEVFTLKKLQL